MFAVGLPNRQGLTNGHQEIRALQLHLDELRGGMDASEYKDYVLVLLFVKYVSDKYAGQKDAMLDEELTFDKELIAAAPIEGVKLIV